MKHFTFAKPKAAGFALLAISLLASACSAGGKEGSTSSPSSSAPPSQSPKETQAANTKYAQKLGLKFMLYVFDSKTALPPAANDFVKKKIEEKFNVDLKIDYMTYGADFNNKLNVMLAGGDLPDFFIADAGVSQKYVNDGLVADLSSYLTPQRMPNYFKVIQQDEVKSYQLKGAVFGRAPIPWERNMPVSYYIRKDWLDKFGLTPPKTYDELLQAMRKFTNDDPDGNGKKDTYGFSAAAGGDRLPMDFPQLLQQGLAGSFQITGDEFSDNVTSPKMQEVLQGVKDMIKEGIVDPDWFVGKSPSHIDKAIQGKIGVIYSSGDRNFALDSDPNSVQSKTKALNPKAEWLPIFPFNTPYIGSENGPGNAAPFMFPKAVADKNPEKIQRVIDILDWLASEEGYLLTHYGIEGTHYKKDGKKITLIPEAYERDIAKNGNFLDGLYSFFMRVTPDVLGLEYIDPRMSDRDRSILKTIYGYPKHKGLPISPAPPQGMNIGDFRKEMAKMQMKVIFDDKDASNWPKYREELMTKYNGQKIFQAYVDQTNEATGKKLVPFK
ncbi:extracellular solute-binding protein [Paenibacillus sp. MBLB4367]|uniref:extracellular solute-binding protein n=1 Tax=Paenibacillus sp. MBLB4367 TaxID=3384767 RepID=UPI0039082789